MISSSNSGSGRSRQVRSRPLQVEGLEDRNLLSTIHTAGIHAATLNKTTKVPVTALRGTATGQIAPAGVYSAPASGYVSYSGHGATLPIGPSLIGFQFLPSSNGTTTTISNGSGQITESESGEQVVVNFSGTGTSRSNGRIFIANLTGTVAGGTGQFNNETGTFTANGRFTGAGHFVLRYNIAINS